MAGRTKFSRQTMAALYRHRRIFRVSELNFSSSQKSNPNPDLKPSTYSMSLKATMNKLFKERDPDKLVDGFKLASESYRFRCRHKIYEVTVHRLAAAGRSDAVEAVLEHQKRFTADLSREGFGVRLITLYGKAGMAAQASSTFDQLPSFGCPRSVKSFNALLAACAAAGDYPRLVAAFGDVRASDASIVPDLISYNFLIKALCEVGDLDAAFSSLTTMKKNGVVPDLISFNTLLSGFYKGKRFSDADKIWDEMTNESIQPDTNSFNAKIKGLVSEGNTWEAVDIVDKMKQLGLKPDISCFNTLIKGHCQDRNLKQAKRVYDELTKNDCAPNKETFMLLIENLCEVLELDLALKLSKESMSRMCYPGSQIIQVLVDALAKNSRVEEAKKLLKISRANGHIKESIRVPLSCLDI